MPKEFRNSSEVPGGFKPFSSVSLNRSLSIFLLVLLFGLAGFAYASILGFKFNIPLIPAGSLADYYFEVSIPFETDLQVANDLLLEVTDATSVIWLEPSTGIFKEWFPSADPEDNFPIIPGEGYIIRVPDGVSTELTIIGKHNSTVYYDLYVGAKDFLISIPYHTKWKKAHDIYKSHPNIAQIATLDPHTNTFTIWVPQPGAGPNNFDIVLGEAYRVRAFAPTKFRSEHF